ncbi:pyridoxal-dependent decarboxylase [Fimicolochytrium jonesii]|uniref:pyridoxal-dependent decarboxylase n=1 Tax=Fimicolochytrium jonesii TaxID=1396493 RepID=UPI0022FDC69D|nr:pyridoxal-dependent decarboxylase [Fimicolochytrium jonesii]KAI8819976.1 pyridoxal-dependent decarboxylase [Fimicolochytrium jonesii]
MKEVIAPFIRSTTDILGQSHNKDTLAKKLSTSSNVATKGSLAATTVAAESLKKKATSPYIHDLSVKTILESRVIDYDPEDDTAEDAFFVGDMGEIKRQHDQWNRLLPRVEPFYAVKCNPNETILNTLANLGTGFDCASKGEIQMALDQGVDPSKIIYANPCKQVSHIRFALNAGVRMMTFDNADELRKIKLIHPTAQMVLRILTDDSRSICKLGTKFGASQAAVPHLLKTARELDMDVIGISFHVGSGCFDAQAFGDAVALARRAFDEGKNHGYEFSLLDVGGGFPGNNAEGVNFHQIAAILGPAIDRYFGPEIRVIAEPGRYYVSSAFTLAVNVIARREIDASGDDHPYFMYYVNDGMYASFNCLTFDHAIVTPRVLARANQFLYNQPTTGSESEFPCSIWGPTCDSIDCIGKKFSLPELQVGDWLNFDNMGAYTMCAASEFNGFKKSKIIFTNTEEGAVTI